MIKLFEQYNEYSKVREWLDELKIQDYTINDDLSVDVDGHVHIYKAGVKEIPIQFNRVMGDFICDNNGLTTLKGCPIYVQVDFDCSNNELSSLEYAPKIVRGDFSCHNNKLTTLKGCPNQIPDDFYCNDNQLTTLEYCPKQIGGVFYCDDNELTTLKYFPEYISGEIYIASNTLPNEILNYNGDIRLLIKYQDEYGLWNNDESFNSGRFNILLKDLNNGTLD